MLSFHRRVAGEDGAIPVQCGRDENINVEGKDVETTSLNSTLNTNATSTDTNDAFRSSWSILTLLCLTGSAFYLKFH